MLRWAGRVALVTGASSGIGAGVCYQLQDHGVHVVAVARRVDRIEESINKARNAAKERGRYQATTVPPGKIYAKKCDLLKEEDILSVFKWIKDNLGGVDILVNNAGLGKDSGLTEAPTQDWKAQLDVNVLALSICTREAVQSMRSRGVDDGHIVHICSIDGHSVHWPTAAMYAATKHAVLALTEGLRLDFLAHKSHMRVTAVSPGMVSSELRDNLSTLNSADFKKIPLLQPEDIADAIIYAVGAPPHVQIHEMIIKPVLETF